jgi:hypothetical protein
MAMLLQPIGAPLLADDEKKDQQMILTPISKDPKKKSNIDYEEQLTRERLSKQFMWDDSRFNKACPGDVFGFVMHGEKVSFRKIESIHSIESRLPSWSVNVGQTNRQVLYLGKKLVTVQWDKWIEQGGHKKVQGTQHVRSNLQELLQLLF